MTSGKMRQSFGLRPKDHMTSEQMRESFGLNKARFYILKGLGAIPAGQSGEGLRKHYSPREVKLIRKRLVKLGEISENEAFVK
jgi:hypothetical protein